MSWEKHHWRLERRRIARVATTPEESGLCGCWQLVKVRRERQPVGSNPMKPSDEVQYYAVSLHYDETTDDELLAILRGHWSAIENGTHHRRDVTFGEDGCRVANRKAAHALATLRNLANGIYELEAARGKAGADGCASWLRGQTEADALALLRR